VIYVYNSLLHITPKSSDAGEANRAVDGNRDSSNQATYSSTVTVTLAYMHRMYSITGARAVDLGEVTCVAFVNVTTNSYFFGK